MNLESACLANPQTNGGHYLLTTHNCTDACVSAMQAAGIDVPDVKKSIGVKYGNFQIFEYPFSKISSPAALARYLNSLPPEN